MCHIEKFYKSLQTFGLRWARSCPSAQNFLTFSLIICKPSEERLKDSLFHVKPTYCCQFNSVKALNKLFSCIFTKKNIKCLASNRFWNSENLLQNLDNYPQQGFSFFLAVQFSSNLVKHKTDSQKSHQWRAKRKTWTSALIEWN